MRRATTRAPRLLFAALTLTVVAAASLGALPSSGGAAASDPANTAPPTIAGTAREGATLTADPGTWTGTQPITYAYEWQRCTATGAGCAAISGATTKTYVLTTADAGATLRVKVTATDSTGATSATSVPTAGRSAPRAGHRLSQRQRHGVRPGGLPAGSLGDRPVPGDASDRCPLDRERDGPFPRLRHVWTTRSGRARLRDWRAL